MNKHLVFLFLIFMQSVNGQTITIESNPSTSNSAVIGQSNYHISEALYTNAEIGTDNFTGTASINQIAFNFTQLSALNTISHYRIWLKNVSTSVASLSSGTYNTIGFTLVLDRTLNITTTGWKNISLDQPFTRIAGSNLLVLIERLDGSIHGALPGNSFGFIVATANGNTSTTTALTYRRYNGVTIPGASTTLSVSSFRPAIQFKYQSPFALSLLNSILPDPSCFSMGQTIGWNIFNSGTDTLRSGLWEAIIHIRGVNTFRDSLIQFQSIAPGDTGQVIFPNVNLSNPGIHIFEMTLKYYGVSNSKTDTLFIARTIRNFPQFTSFENTDTVFPYRKIIAGSRNLWTLQTGNYNNPDQALPLTPRQPGNRFMLFDAYNGENSSGNIDRLYSACIDLNRWGILGSRSAKVKFWMSHDPLFELSKDSLYVVVSTNQGLTWNRIAGYARVNPFLTEPTWMQDSVSLSAYWGQTIQIGFEGVSDFGNAFGLDDVEIQVEPNCLQVPSVYAGRDTAICHSTGYLLSGGSPSFDGPISSVYWRTSGTGSFEGGSSFNQAIRYYPSIQDLTQGMVQIQLIALAEDTVQCPADTSDFDLQIFPQTDTTLMISSCAPVNWQGNLIGLTGEYIWNGTNQFGCDSIIRLFYTRLEIDSTFLQVSSCNPYSFQGNLLHTSGRYTSILINQFGCDSVLILDFSRQSATYFIDTQYQCKPFFWRGQRIDHDSTYTHVITNSAGCDSIETLVAFLGNCSVKFSFKVFTEGFYRGGGVQATLLYDLGISNQINDVDTMRLICSDSMGFSFFETYGISNQSGWVEFGIPSVHQNKRAYLSIRHKSSIPVWSENLVYLSGLDSIDLASSRQWIYEDGANDPLAITLDTTRALYTGDLNQDGTVDIFDAQLAENEAALFSFGYQTGDLNGDGSTDIFDLQLLENNGARFIFTASPF